MPDPFKGTPFWQPAAPERAALLSHLISELPAGHLLWTHQDTLDVVGRDRDGDRVVVLSGDPAAPASIVHMSWAGRPAMAPFLPETEVFASLDTLIQSNREVSDA